MSPPSLFQVLRDALQELKVFWTLTVRSSNRPCGRSLRCFPKSLTCSISLLCLWLP